MDSYEIQMSAYSGDFGDEYKITINKAEDGYLYYGYLTYINVTESQKTVVEFTDTDVSLSDLLTRLLEKLDNLTEPKYENS